MKTKTMIVESLPVFQQKPTGGKPIVVGLFTGSLTYREASVAFVRKPLVITSLDGRFVRRGGLFRGMMSIHSFSARPFALELNDKALTIDTDDLGNPISVSNIHHVDDVGHVISTRS